MNFLVLGCNGMAGHTISLYLKEQGHEIQALIFLNLNMLIVLLVMLETQIFLEN